MVNSVTLSPTAMTDSPQMSNDLRLKYEDLRKEFRNITSLLAVTTAINNRGVSILPYKKIYDEPYQTLLDTNLPTPILVTQAIAILNVRKHEVVATIVCDPNIKPTSVKRTNSTFNPETTLQIFAYAEQRDWEDIKFESFLPTFTTFANPENDDEYFGDLDNTTPMPHCTLVPPGTSHWELIQGEWTCLNINLQ